MFASRPQKVLCVHTGSINILFSVIGSTKIDSFGPNLEWWHGTLTKIVNQSCISKDIKALAWELQIVAGLHIVSGYGTEMLLQ